MCVCVHVCVCVCVHGACAEASPFWVSLVEQVRVEIRKLSLVTGTPWKDFPVCRSFSGTSAQVLGRDRTVLASSAFFASI